MSRRVAAALGIGLPILLPALLARPAAAHGTTHAVGHPPWVGLGLVALGGAALGGGLYADRRADDNDARVDAAVVVGLLALLSGFGTFWLL